ncbi:MAG: hypothetical protein O0W99_05005, partial [Methanocorpusculum sp.]|nr:hypothetical protein [Methanocorpusculum sp.]
KFTMSGGVTSNNSATKGRGGGVAMSYAAVFTMSGGEISGNTAKKGGGVDVLTGGTFTLSGGTISDNTATEYGGVYLSTHEIRDLILELSNVTFRNNKDTSGTTNTAIRLDIYSTSPSSTYKYSLAGATSFGNDQALSISYLPEDGIHIKDGFTGSLKQLVLDNESLDGKTIFTIDDTAGGTASELLPRFTLADTRKWTLAADDAGKKIVGTLNKPVALSGAENVAVEWINATIANVSIRLDPNANDATDVHVKLGENPSQTVSGTFAKGSTISGLQVTGLTAGSTYSVTAVLKNSGISEKEFTSDPLLEVTAPVPDRVVITGEGGAEITGDSITIGHGTSATFGARVYNGSLLLKDEPVTWEKVDDDNGHLTLSDQTATTVNVTGVSATSPDEPKLKATAGKNPSANKAVTILVSDAEITAIAVTPTIAAVETGAAAQITITATDADSKNRAGEPITWELDPGLIRTGGDTSGTTAAFTAAAAGTYTATAKLTSDTTKTADVTITVVGKPAITAQPQSATYTKGQAEADPLTVSATAPGSQALTYQWQKSTDPTFAADVSTVGSDAASYTPDISSAGTFYYRANVTYTESGITTWTHSSAAKITVLEPTADSITLSPGDTSVTIQKGNAAQITATAKNSTLDRVLDSASIVWAVQSGAAYASITQNGNQVTITGNNGGTAVITATSGTAVARVTVIVNDPAKTTHTITATAGSGGSISPAGAIPVVEGQGQAFDIIPNPGYIVRDVKVDGASVGAITYYSFANVKETHTISAEFSEASFTITATAGAGGSISPSGAVTVPAGESRTFTITPDAGNTIADVIVDGASVGARGSYTFSSVYEGHTIAAAFQQAPTPTPPRPTPSGGGDGYSSTDSGSVSATGQVSFGT